MRTSRTAVAALVLALPALLAGCTTTASGNWEPPRTENGPYKNILVVALSAHDGFRTTLERQLATGISQNMAANGSRASASTSLVPKLKDAPRDREGVMKMLKEIDADALLLMRTTDSSIKLGKSQEEKDKYLFGDQDKKTKQPSDSEGSWATPHQADETDILPDTKIKGTMQAVLYDIADNDRAVYSIDVTARYKEKGGETIFIIADEIATAVTEELRKKGLVK